MQAKKRYALVFLTVVLLSLFIHQHHLNHASHGRGGPHQGQLRRTRNLFIEINPKFNVVNYGTRHTDTQRIPFSSSSSSFSPPSGKSDLINIPQTARYLQKHHRSTLSNYGKSFQNILPFHPTFQTFNVDNQKIEKVQIPAVLPPPRECTLDKCLEMFKCQQDLTVYIYPEAFDSLKYKKSSQWSLFDRIIYIIKQSQFYTSNPEKACIFIAPFDTLVRDRLDDLYVERVSEKVRALPYWNNGRNHLIFNLYAGTWPDYLEDLNFDYGYAMVAKASFSEEFYRPGYDISLPLFKKEQTQFKGVDHVDSKQQLYPSKRDYLLTFKGKRYLTGIGSETRNLLYQIDNQRDTIMLTTCKHGKDWERYADARCSYDNAQYSKFDYDELMVNSTFCLVPRGRRLGSFRFLESLKATCVPVVMANSWVLPFSEVLDWSAAVVNFDERHHIISPLILRHVDNEKIFNMRQQGVFLYHAYFSSLERIVLTSLEIIRERIFPQIKKPQWMWNHGEGITGALAARATGYSVNYDLSYPIFSTKTPETRFSAIIQVVSPQVKPLINVLKTLEKTEPCGQVLLIWNLRHLPAKLRKQIDVFKKVELIEFSATQAIDDISAKFGPQVLEKLKFNAVLTIDDDVTLIPDELKFGFEVWQTIPSQIVGFPNRLHYWLQGTMSDADGKIQKITRWAYTSKFHNEYSLVLTGASFIHRYYLSSYSNATNIGGHTISRSIVDKYKNCEDILMNFVVADLTGRPPVKISQRKRYKSTDSQGVVDGASVIPGMENTAENAPLAPRWTEKSHFQERQICMNKFSEDFGYMPLQSSQIRLDPTLYKDNVAAWRKQYKSIEMVVDE